jgi:hypothetical protein
MSRLAMQNKRARTVRESRKCKGKEDWAHELNCLRRWKDRYDPTFFPTFRSSAKPAITLSLAIYFIEFQVRPTARTRKPVLSNAVARLRDPKHPSKPTSTTNDGSEGQLIPSTANLGALQLFFDVRVGQAPVVSLPHIETCRQSFRSNS